MYLSYDNNVFEDAEKLHTLLSYTDVPPQRGSNPHLITHAQLNIYNPNV
jgi:hypothetical protein